MSPSFCFSADSASEISERIRNFSDFRPTLGIIFSSVALGIPDLASEISRAGFPVFGCSTSGEILAGEEENPVLEQSAVCCLFDIDPTVFSVALFEKNDISSFDFGSRIGSWGKEKFSRPAYIVTMSGLKNDGEALVRGIESVNPPGTRIFGGIAGDDGKFLETYVFSHTGYSADGAAVIVFDQSRVEVNGIATSGWTGVGGEMVITSSEGNIVRSINNRSPVEIFKEYLQVRDEDLQDMAVSFPLLVKRPDGSEILRTFLSINFETGSLAFAGTMPQGTRVRFSSSFGHEIIEKSVQDLTTWHRQHPRADLILLFSCMARHHVFGPMVTEEISAASDLWNAPLIGLFTYGEIGHNFAGICDFYNETLSLVSIEILRDPR
ncbi:MAG: hypothetical protein CVV30_00040 [Methanomicrobiales archaeon HGW-Methanomicrobiales-1]|jgi:hypothetical protein|nr:MAG: hypothetical protein CVV30_00040 [Methanomicrobiales archaeon HGW-Methanomicrobiales-1]